MESSGAELVLSADQTAPNNAGAAPNNAGAAPNKAGAAPKNAGAAHNNAGAAPVRTEILFLDAIAIKIHS